MVEARARVSSTVEAVYEVHLGKGGGAGEVAAAGGQQLSPAADARQGRRAGGPLGHQRGLLRCRAVLSPGRGHRPHGAALVLAPPDVVLQRYQPTVVSALRAARCPAQDDLAMHMNEVIDVYDQVSNQTMTLPTSWLSPRHGLHVKSCYCATGLRMHSKGEKCALICGAAG